MRWVIPSNVEILATGKKIMKNVVFLFGEAEKGALCIPLLLRNLAQLADTYGEPLEGSMGIHCAIRALGANNRVIYFRVQEEGFSAPDYLSGLKLLQNNDMFYDLAALGMPGMSNPDILGVAKDICIGRRALFMTNERDFFDFLTHKKGSILPSK